MLQQVSAVFLYFVKNWDCILFISLAVSVREHRPNAVFLIYFISALNSTVNGKIKYATAVSYLIWPFTVLFKASRHTG
jgi:hypothetical protein